MTFWHFSSHLLNINSREIYILSIFLQCTMSWTCRTCILDQYYIIFFIVFLEKLCDGVVNCLFGEDEGYGICKDQNVFPADATIECVEDRPGYNITIKVIIQLQLDN